MVFIPPTWFEGMLITGALTLVPFLIGLFIILYGMASDKIICILLGIIVLVAGLGCSTFIWYDLYEIPSVDEKIITVQEWQPRVGLGTNSNGMMVVDSADDLMLVTTDGECYFNQEDFWFQKFNTRDVFNQLKVNGTYKIKYYGWREPFNSGFPNILTVEEVIDENNTHTPRYSDYFGVKLVNQ